MRLTLLAHAETLNSRQMIFGDESGLVSDPGVEVRASRAGLSSGPELACRQTCRLLGGPVEVEPGLAGPYFGRWIGRSLASVMSEDPTGVAVWLRDPDATPHGGESLAEMAGRVGRVLDEHKWPASGAIAVVSPLVVRAALAHALDTSAASMLRADVGPLGSVTVTRHSRQWRLISFDRTRRTR